MTGVVQDKPHGLTGRASNRKGKGLRPPSVTVSVRLPEWLRDLADIEADASGQTLNAFIVDAVQMRVADSSQP